MLATTLFRKSISLVLFVEGITTLVACLFVLFLVKTDVRPEKKNLSIKNSFSAFIASKEILVFLIGLLMVILVYEQYIFNLPLFLIKNTLLESFSGENIFGALIALNSVIVVVFSGFVIEKTKDWSKKKSFLVSSTAIAIGYFFLIFPTIYSVLVFGILWAFGEILLINTTVAFFLDHFGKENRSFALSCRYIFRYFVTGIVPIFFAYASEIFGITRVWALSPLLVFIGLLLMFRSDVLKESAKEAGAV